MSSTNGSATLRLILQAGSAISGTETKSVAKSKPETHVSEVLARRLVEFDTIMGSDNVVRQHRSVKNDLNSVSELGKLTNDELELLTADAALWVVIQVQALTTGEDITSAPDLGTRDLNQIRTLVAIVFKWGVDRRIGRLLDHWTATSSASPQPANSSQSATVVVLDDSNVADEISKLEDMARQLLGLVFSVSLEGSSSLLIHSNHISKTLLTRHPSGLIKICVVLACYTNDQFMKDSVNRLLSILPISQNMVSLGAMTSKSMPGKVRAVCGALLSEQLLRPDGLRGLFGATFGEDNGGESDMAPLPKLEHVARIVSIIPNRMPKQDYLSVIIPRILEILGFKPQTRTPPPGAHMRAAAFTLSRIVKAHPQEVKPLFRLLHHPFLTPSKIESESDQVFSALGLIRNVLLRTDPTSTLPQCLVTPILPPLYSLLAHLDRVRTSDPALKELVRSILRTWGGCVSVDEAVEGWWEVVKQKDGWGDGAELHWEVFGEDMRVGEGREPETILLPSPVHDESDSDNFLQLRPDPSHLVALLKTIKRDDVNSTLLVRALNEYQTLQKSDGEPLQTMLRLKLVMEMVDQLGSTALTQPEHILTFVAVVLEPAVSKSQHNSRSSNKKEYGGLGLDDLRIVEIEDEDDDGETLDGSDSDDEGPDDMIVTALDLLLAVLEAHPSLTPMNTRLLQVISHYLEPLALHPSDSIRSLAREARLILTARNASTSSMEASASIQQDDPQKALQIKYQQGLKLLQDPLLPVRAHGLVILRQIVLSLRSNTSDTTVSSSQALVPSILSIFLQTVQEDDSFIFLNAVQGLVAMVDVVGREILKGLIEVYTGGTTTGSLPYSLEKADLDKRIRVGEALNQSIRKCGDTLPSYADILIPALFGTVRSKYLPTALRSSALSLLAQCAETSRVAILPWCLDLCNGTLDLLQLESVSASQLPKANQQDENLGQSDSNTSSKSPSNLDREVMDTQPLSVDTKLAPFRRSALHFLSLLLKSILEEQRASDPSQNIELSSSSFRIAKSTALHDPPFVKGVDGYMSQELIKRLQILLRYIRATDVDSIVRVMSMEILELVDSLQMMVLGL